MRQWVIIIAAAAAAVTLTDDADGHNNIGDDPIGHIVDQGHRLLVLVNNNTVTATAVNSCVNNGNILLQQPLGGAAVLLALHGQIINA